MSPKKFRTALAKARAEGEEQARAAVHAMIEASDDAAAKERLRQWRERQGH